MSVRDCLASWRGDGAEAMTIASLIDDGNDDGVVAMAWRRGDDDCVVAMSWLRGDGNDEDGDAGADTAAVDGAAEDAMR
jgi:hypothetical protein